MSIANLYLAQSSAGAADGSSAVNARPIADFNDASKWGAGSTQIGQDTTVHICGTITTAITFQASGAAGHVIKLLFESGGNFSKNTWTSGYIIECASASYIEIDGGVNGFIEATDVGSSPTYGHQDSFGGIHFSSSSHVSLHNLIIRGIYVHNTTASVAGGNSVVLSGVSNSRFYSNTMSDAGFNFDWTILSSADVNNEIDHNTFSRTSKNVVLGVSGAVTLDNWKIHDNDFSDWLNWDDASDNYHHAGVHFYLEGTAGAVVTNVQIYNNYFHGDEGLHMTAPIYFEGNSGTFTTPLFFNNVFSLTNPGQVFDGDIYLKGSVTGAGYYNNTHAGNIGAICVQLQGPTGFISKNNIFLTAATIYEFSGTPIATADHNCYFNNSAFGPGASDNATLALWKAATGLLETGSITINPNLTAFAPSTSSGVYQAGTNLTGLGVTALDSDKNALARPSSAAWDIGAIAAAAAAGASLRGRSVWL